MEREPEEIQYTDLADGTRAGPEWDAWLAEHPEAAAQVEMARRVRALMAELRAASIEVPADFEARLMERLRVDSTLLHLLDLGFIGLGRALLELLDLFLGFLPGGLPTGRGAEPIQAGQEAA